MCPYSHRRAICNQVGSIVVFFNASRVVRSVPKEYSLQSVAGRVTSWTTCCHAPPMTRTAGRWNLSKNSSGNSQLRHFLFHHWKAKKKTKFHLSPGHQRVSLDSLGIPSWIPGHLERSGHQRHWISGGPSFGRCESLKAGQGHVGEDVPMPVPGSRNPRITTTVVAHLWGDAPTWWFRCENHHGWAEPKPHSCTKMSTPRSAISAFPTQNWEKWKIKLETHQIVPNCASKVHVLLAMFTIWAPIIPLTTDLAYIERKIIVKTTPATSALADTMPVNHHSFPWKICRNFSSKWAGGTVSHPKRDI